MAFLLQGRGGIIVAMLVLMLVLVGECASCHNRTAAYALEKLHFNFGVLPDDHQGQEERKDTGDGGGVMANVSGPRLSEEHPTCAPPEVMREHLHRIDIVILILVIANVVVILLSLKLLLDNLLDKNRSHRVTVPYTSGHAFNFDTFLCYRSENGKMLARLIKMHLEANGHRVYLDQDEMQCGLYRQTLLAAIRRCRHFVCVCSAGSLDRCMEDHQGQDFFHREVRYALRMRRIIIPVWCEDFEVPDRHDPALPKAIRVFLGYNAVKCSMYYFDVEMDRIVLMMRNSAHQAVEIINEED